MVNKSKFLNLIEEGEKYLESARLGNKVLEKFKNQLSIGFYYQVNRVFIDGRKNDKIKNLLLDWLNKNKKHPSNLMFLFYEYCNTKLNLNIKDIFVENYFHEKIGFKNGKPVCVKDFIIKAKQGSSIFFKKEIKINTLEFVDIFKFKIEEDKIIKNNDDYHNVIIEYFFVDYLDFRLKLAKIKVEILDKLHGESKG